jgi:hypothetical protein
MTRAKPAVGLLIVVAAAVTLATRACSDDATRSSPPGSAPDSPQRTTDEADARTAEPQRRRIRPEAPVVVESRPPAPPAATESAFIDVRVRTGDGTAATGTVTFFVDGVSEPVGSTAIDVGGRAQLQLEPGLSGRVGVATSRFVPWISEPLVTEEGRRAIDVALDPGLGVTGLVVATDGATPVPGAPVWVWTTDFGGRFSGHGGRDDRRRVVTDDSGRFHVRGLAPGKVNLDVREVPGHPELGERAFRAVRAGTDGVRLRMWRQVGVRFELVDARTQRGPLAERIEVIELRDDGPVAISTSWHSSLPESDPEPAIVPRTPWKVWGSDTHRFVVRALGYEDSDPIVVDPNVGDSPRVVRVELVPDAGSTGVLELSVVTAAGDVPELVAVTRFSTGGRSSTGSHARPVDGVVRLEVAPGSVHVRLGAGVGAARSESGPYWVAEDVSLDMERGATVARRVVLQPGGRIRVRGPDRETGSEAPDRVLFLGEQLDLHFALSGDEEGTAFTCDAVPPGRYVLEFDRGEDDPARIECDVRAHEITLVRSPRR